MLTTKLEPNLYENINLNPKQIARYPRNYTDPWTKRIESITKQTKSKIQKPAKHNFYRIYKIYFFCQSFLFIVQNCGKKYMVK